MTVGLSKADAKVKIEALLEEFYDPGNQFAELGQCHSTRDLPSPFGELLDHNAHMTVTVEAHHGDKVNVVVHRSHRHVSGSDDWYVREITLTTQGSGKVVQYGIVRLNVNALAPEVWKRIESQESPLGRVLIEHNVLREVQLCELWQFQCGPELAKFLKLNFGDIVYGRTALIYCDGEPAIELLEIVCP